ncbi:MAG: ATP-dependent protease ATPase subunit HslU [Planctomycetota bacterium]
MDDLTPRQIVDLLDRHIVGQQDAKRAVAIAIRNRWRRQRLSEEMRAEVTPKNIIMIGPTGVGKTEIARRLAALVQAPFCKVEATKYTEVGYHGRDVESVIRELTDVAWRMVRDKERQNFQAEAEQRTENRLLDLLFPSPGEEGMGEGEEADSHSTSTLVVQSHHEQAEKHKRARERMRAKLVAGELEDRKIQLRTEQKHIPVQIFSNLGMEQMDVDLQNMFDRVMPKASKSREVTVREARRILVDQEVEQLIDREAVGENAVRLTEESGIVFIDEIDKICGTSAGHGPDVSRQGVQRDLLPIVEGTAVQTRYGTVHTEHILFIAAGAFHLSKPSDLMPELQGRFPIRVELKDLGQNDFVRILREPKGSLVRQYTEMLSTEGLGLSFTEDAIDAIAEIAYEVNRTTQNIGARRLHTILERLLEDASFDAPDSSGKKLQIDAAYVREKLGKISANEDLSKYIL